MNKSVDSTKPMRIYDGDSISKRIFIIEKVLYSDEYTCLAIADDQDKVMFNKHDGTIISNNFDSSWLVENYTLNVINSDDIQKGVDFVKSAFVDDSKGLPALLLGDAAKLIEILTHAKFSEKDFFHVR
jgi:hypothetical protein